MLNTKQRHFIQSRRMKSRRETTTKYLCRRLTRGIAIALLAGIFGAAAQARADVTTAAYWRLGESDGGAIPGNPVSPVAVDQTNTYHLNLVGSSTINNASYTADLAASAFAATGSTLGIRFDNLIPGEPTHYVHGDPILSATDNWGLEAWVRAASATPVNGSQAAILYDGTFGASGYGLYQVGDQYQSVLGGSTVFVGTAPVDSDWVHLALVRDGGLTTFYLNGVAQGSNEIAPLRPSGAFSLAALQDGSDPFAGTLDEVRLFTFSPGQFSVGDLMFNQQSVPEPASLTLLGAGLLALLGTVRRRMQPTAPAQPDEQGPATHGRRD